MVSRSFSMRHLSMLTTIGPVYRLSFGKSTTVFVSSYELVREVCDDTRFKKSIEGELEVEPCL